MFHADTQTPLLPYPHTQEISMLQFLQTAKSKLTIVALVCSSLLSGCFEPAPPAEAPTQATASRFLHMATFGPNQTEIDKLVSVGWEAWMTEQFALPLTDSHYDYTSRGGKPGCDTCDASNDPLLGLQSSFWFQTLEGQDQLRQRVAFALSELFVISGDASSELFDYPDAVAAFQDVLYQNAFGNFRTILEKVSTHPSMGAMLSHKQNRKEDPVTGQLPDENYAREVMQLFTIGKWMLNNDGTRVKDANGNDVPAYTQSDVMGMAKAMSGWSWGGDDVSEARWNGFSLPTGENPRVWNLQMQAYAQHHSSSEKQLVNGTVIPAGTDAANSMKIALDALFMHPNAGPFVATHLIKRLVTSNPSPAYVGRVASVFSSDKNAVRGNMQAVVRAVLFDPEAHDPAVAAGPTWGKLREPVIRLANYLRAFNMRNTNGIYPIGLSEPGVYHYGQSPWRAKTVFNFFMPDHQPLGELSTQNLTAPEFQIFDESTSAGYVNFMALGVNGVDYAGFAFGGDFTDAGRRLKANYTTELALANNPGALVDRIALMLNGGYLSAETRSAVIQALESIPVAAIPADKNQAWDRKRVKTAIVMVMSSPDYLIQK
jgi:uncharacterized protein (DUF1800 family)